MEIAELEVEWIELRWMIVMLVANGVLLVVAETMARVQVQAEAEAESDFHEDSNSSTLQGNETYEVRAELTSLLAMFAVHNFQLPDTATATATRPMTSRTQ